MRQSLGKLALFLLCVVIVAISIGMLLSQLRLGLRAAKDVVVVVSLLAAIGSYMAAYKPGWLYKSLTEMSKEE